MSQVAERELEVWQRHQALRVRLGFIRQRLSWQNLMAEAARSLAAVQMPHGETKATPSPATPVLMALAAAAGWMIGEGQEQRRRAQRAAPSPKRRTAAARTGAAKAAKEKHHAQHSYEHS